MNCYRDAARRAARLDSVLNGLNRDISVIGAFICRETFVGLNTA
jgi:hypothetical protein